MYNLITPQNIDHYFTFKHIPGCGKQFRPMTFIKNEASFDEAKEWIRKKLFDETDSLLKQCNDVHILLSGGLDSCITLHLIRQITTKRPIISHTLNYTGTWEGKETDLDYARRLSALYNTEHHEHIVTANEMIQDMPKIVRKLKTPFAGFVSPYFAAKMLPPNIPVFTGDLSDELFGSYKGPREAGAQKFNNIGDAIAWRTGLKGWCVFNCSDKEKLYTDEFKKKVDITSSTYLALNWMRFCGDYTNSMLAFDWVSAGPDQVFYSPQRLMSQQDFAPYMNDEFIDYVTALPGEFKVKDGNVKHILKEAFRGHIPDYVIERKKEGFVQPSNHWLFNNWKDTASIAIRNISNDVINKEYSQKIVDEFYSGNQELVYKVWTMFCYAMWEICGTR